MRKINPFILSGLLILAIIIWFISRKKENTPTDLQAKIGKIDAIPKEIDVQPFVTEAGWGYIIYMKGKPYIRQDNIPVVEGNKGFTTREKALKAGQMVARKIEQAILPPTISKQELDSLQLLN